MIHSANLAGPRYFKHVSSVVGLLFRSQYSEFSMVILYSWLCLSELATSSMRKFLIISLLALYSVLSGFSLSWVFWSILGELVCIWHISNVTAEGQHHAMQGLILYYGFQRYRFLWILSALVRSLIEVLLIISLNQLTLYYSECVSLLKFWQCSFISRHQISIIVAPSEDVYIYGRRAEMSQS